MAKYKNFYENLTEARFRLHGTVVMYDGEPYYILCIDNHKPNEIFRVYLVPIGLEGMDHSTMDVTNPDINSWGLMYREGEYKGIGEKLDEWLKAHPNSPILRKEINSPKFDKFRPFPLGMLNANGTVYYCARRPKRNKDQGLIRSMVALDNVSIMSSGRGKRNKGVSIYSHEFRQCILNDHPSFSDCWAQLKNPAIANDGAAFDREFALIRGPAGTIFLVYRDGVVGSVRRNPDNTFELTLEEEYKYLTEVIEELDVFSWIGVN